MTKNTNAIGGYLPWELQSDAEHFHEQAYKFQSARYALEAWLVEAKPLAVWIPWFLCDAVLEPITRLGINVKRYSLGSDFYPQDKIEVSAGEFIFVINYFGICENQIDKFLAEYEPQSLIIDNSQAFFSLPKFKVAATIYSARKFIGVPSGGYLYSERKLTNSYPVDENSPDELKHLITRRIIGTETGFEFFQENEKRFEKHGIMQMSHLVDVLLKRSDYDQIADQRLSNFLYLHKQFNSNIVSTDSAIISPISYPLVCNEQLRNELKQQKIYTPIYWPTKIIKNINCQASLLAKSIIHLPIDQNLTKQDMDMIVNVVQGFAEL